MNSQYVTIFPEVAGMTDTDPLMHYQRIVIAGALWLEMERGYPHDEARATMLKYWEFLMDFKFTPDDWRIYLQKYQQRKRFEQWGGIDND